MYHARGASRRLFCNAYYRLATKLLKHFIMEKPDLVYIYAFLILKGIWHPSVHLRQFDF